MTNKATVEVTIKSGKAFRDAVKRAKQLGGTYHPNTKSWTIPAINPYTDKPWDFTNSIYFAQFAGNHDSNCPARWGGACECR